MGFLDRLFGKGKQEAADDGIYFYVRCNRCDRVLHTRLDPQRDLNPRDGGGYEVRKEMMDDRCFRPFFLHATFDGGKKLEEVTVDGGTLIDRESWAEEKDAPRRP